MNLDNTYAALPWDEAFLKISEKQRIDFEPVLIVKGESDLQSEKLKEQILKQKNTYLISLGVTTPLSNFAQEMVHKLDPKHPGFSGRYFLHHHVAIRLKKMKGAFSGVHHVVVDNCHFFDFRLFQMLGIVNEMEGKMVFTFLIAQNYLHHWSENEKLTKPLGFFMTIVKHKYKLDD